MNFKRVLTASLAGAMVFSFAPQARAVVTDLTDEEFAGVQSAQITVENSDQLIGHIREIMDRSVSSRLSLDNYEEGPIGKINWAIDTFHLGILNQDIPFDGKVRCLTSLFGISEETAKKICSITTQDMFDRLGEFEGMETIPEDPPKNSVFAFLTLLERSKQQLMTKQEEAEQSAREKRERERLRAKDDPAKRVLRAYGARI